MLKEVSAQANVIAMLVGVSMECHLQQRPVLDAWHRTKIGAALENFITKKCFQNVFFVSTMLWV